MPPAGIEAAFTLFGYYADMIAERRRRPTDDLTSALLVAEIDGDRLADADIVAFLFLMVVAGNETTTKLLGHALYWAWRNPDERAKVWNGSHSIDEWVEETLRYDTSSQMLARVTTTDLTYYGQTIPKGDRVLLLAGSANRDERAFADPDRYDLDRDRESVGIASFGVGRHFCMGASLARLEAKVALEEFIARFAGYEIDGERSRRVHSTNVRGFATLPTTLAVR